jgi:hypothetical protein
MLLKITKDSNGKYYVSPNTLALQSTFLIECESKAGADLIVLEISNITSFIIPATRPDLFKSIGFVGEIEVFKAIKS